MLFSLATARVVAELSAFLTALGPANKVYAYADDMSLLVQP